MAETILSKLCRLAINMVVPAICFLALNKVKIVIVLGDTGLLAIVAASFGVFYELLGLRVATAIQNWRLISWMGEGMRQLIGLVYLIAFAAEFPQAVNNLWPNRLWAADWPLILAAAVVIVAFQCAIASAWNGANCPKAISEPPAESVAGEADCDHHQ